MENKPVRRVGTFTMGIALILTGAGLFGCMFFPAAWFILLCKCAPLLLVLLGIEILISVKKCRTAR